MPSQISGSSAVAIQVYQALYGRAPSNALLNSYTAQASANPQQTSAQAASAFANDLAGGFSTTTNAALALQVLNNVNITATTVTAPGSYATLLSALEAAFLGFGPASRGQIILNLTNLLAKLEGDATYGVAATGFNNQAYANFVYGSNPANVTPAPVAAVAASIGLVIGADNALGTSGNDLFIAAIFDNKNTLESGDKISGGAGADRLSADIGESQRFAITAETSSVETVAIRAQAEQKDSGQNNVAGRVQIDAQRMKDVTQWESNNSRADVLVEDVRINDNQKTKDITIAFVESDPGNVDFGVYFDQYSLRSQSATTSVLTLQLMDTRSQAAGTGPLKDNPYDSFAFLIGGTPVIVKSAAIDNALTYADLRTAIENAINALKPTTPALANFVVTLGANYTVFDTFSGQAVVGQSIVLTDTGGGVLSVNPLAGWATPSGVVPPSSGLHTNISNAATTVVELVTSKVILDDVGRGSTGGDLVIGGLSTGDSSSSLGVQRFEIEVRDNSKLQTINSTNNTLREVVLVNGLTTSDVVTPAHAGVPTVKDKGNFTANGNTGGNGVNVTTNNTPLGNQDADGIVLPGSTPQNATGYGFADVRLIDASAMVGKAAFSATVTAASITKYMNLRDIQALPAGDNIAFLYNGGVNDDAIYATLDTAVTSSRSTIVAGREDFTFTTNGGAGNDALTVYVAGNVVGPLSTMNGGAQAWYTNQKLNANVFVNGGDGNDTIRTPGAGDKIIDGGTGLDTIYTDNSGSQNTTAVASGASTTAAAAYDTDAALDLARSISARTAADIALNSPASTVTTTSPALASLVAAQAALDTLNLVTPVDFPAAPIAHTTIATATANAVTALAITLAQKIALDAAYNAETGGVVVPPVAFPGVYAITSNTAVAGNLTAAEFAAGNAALAAIIATNKTALAAAQSAIVANAQNNAYLTGTEATVVANTLLVNGVVTGTATDVTNLAAVQAALIVGATAAQVTAALDAAVLNGAITAGQGNALFAAAGAFPMVQAGFDAVQFIIQPLAATFAALNATAQTNLATSVTADNAAVDAQAAVAPATLAAIAAADLATANGVVTATNAALATETAKTANLATLKAAIAVGTTDLAVNLAVAAAAGADPAVAGQAANILTAADSNVNGVAVTAAQKTAVDLIITQLQLSNELLVTKLTNDVASAVSIQAAASIASLAATAASNSGAGGGAGNTVTVKNAVFVVNTANQLAVVTGATYDLVTNDERNLADLKSDANNSYNLHQSQLTVTFKGITKTVTVDSTAYRTSDLQVNQAIKSAINGDPVLSKLLSANDGPSNTLVISSLIDGQMSNANLAITLAVPAVGVVSSIDIAAAAIVYGSPATEAGVLAAMAAAKVLFDTKADYIDQMAETGAAGGNAEIRGAASLSSSDNTVTGGVDNDVIVLGTTVRIDAISSSNEIVVYSGVFGNDTVVNFALGGLGIDQFNFTVLNGRAANFGSLSADKSVVVAAETLANDTAAEVAALFTDSATAIAHVYIAYNASNIANVYSVVDAAGVAAGNVTATLVGTIDLADTDWALVTAANFI